MNRKRILWGVLLASLLSYNLNHAAIAQPESNPEDSIKTLTTSLEALQGRLIALQRRLADLKFSQSTPPDYTRFEQLVYDMKYYKTTNAGHGGHLYEHCMWVAQVMHQWFEDTNDWVEGIDAARYRNLLVLAGFLHDVGKAGNPTYRYKIGYRGYFDTTHPFLKSYPYFFTIASHPQDGFNYFMHSPALAYRPSLLEYRADGSCITPASCKAAGSCDCFDTLKAMGLDDEQIKLIAVLVGIHYEFGMLLQFEDHEAFVEKLGELVKNIGYNNGLVDAQLVRMAVLIGAADVMGIGPKFEKNSQDYPWSDQDFENFVQRYPWFRNRDLFEKPKGHGRLSCLIGWTPWHYDTKGLPTRIKLLEFFDQNYPAGCRP